MQISSKIAINIEGIVIDKEGNRLTLDNGKIIVITKDTVFETQNIAERVEVNNIIEIGNFIQGFTMDDINQEVITALVINHNEEI